VDVRKDGAPVMDRKESSWTEAMVVVRMLMLL
jgi:hypothetical protein